MEENQYSVQDKNRFEEALLELSSFKRRHTNFKGRFVQLFLGLKFYQNEFPSMFSNRFLESSVFQTMLDDLYSKGSRNMNSCVLMLFENSYLARTGVVGVGNSYSQNTWRNNLNIQKGIGCYAPPSELASQTFLNEARINCRHLAVIQEGSLEGATCKLCESGGSYRKEEHRKWLRLDPMGGGSSAVDLMNIDNFIPYLVPGNQKIPLNALIRAIYFDSSPGTRIADRVEVYLQDFMADFNFSVRELESYFDYSSTPERTVDFSKAVQYRPLTVDTIVQPEVKVHIPDPVLTGSKTVPIGVNTGWEAEQIVAQTLIASGLEVHDVSRQKLGYDLIAKKGRHTWLIDVKSSLSYCSPSLTSREWYQANSNRSNYLLAIIENFNPLEQNVIFWVRDIAALNVRSRQDTMYSISRAEWAKNSMGVDIFEYLSREEK